MILVIDDEPGMVRGLVQLLRRDGYRVETASNGRQALARLQVHRYDVILSDLHMPELDGPAFYALLRQQYDYLRQRVIFITGDFCEADSLVFLEQCGEQWLRKPFTITAIRSAIQQVLCAAAPMQKPGTAGRDRKERLQQLWTKSQGLRRQSQALVGKMQALCVKSERLRAQAAILK